ncbi:MAG TPA: hypothetical protein ENH06_01825 [bacterium]|nr:hypothetical protein [bacterium]
MFEIKNLKKAANRILEAVRDKEKIILYGDSDPDGAVSVIVLEEALNVLGYNNIKVYFPDREKEGYGLNEKALKFLKKYAPALLITLDCGIGSVKEVEIAKKMGFEVIIVDHHEVLPKIPKALIVDPKQKDDEYPFKQFACAGVSYKLSRLLLFLGNKKHEPEKFLELVALATLTDQMPLIDENLEFVKQGISALNISTRPGLKILRGNASFDLKQVREKILPVLNGAGTLNHLNEAYVFLSEKSLKKVELMIKKLNKKTGERRQKIKEIFEEIEERIQSKTDQDFIVFEGDSSWPLVLAGPVASKICNKYKRPTFIFKNNKKESPGSVRVPQNFNGVNAMESCKNLLETYGGHPLACGFRVKNKNLELFKNCLIKYFKKHG